MSGSGDLRQPNTKLFETLIERNHTMLTMDRLRSLQSMIFQLDLEKIPGALIETGCWRGGALVAMRDASPKRAIYGLDSFEGWPKPEHPEDEGSEHYRRTDRATLEDTERVLHSYGVMDVILVKGWFKDTLPTLLDEKWAMLRLDGNLYKSTKPVLEALYPKLASGGFVIIDDWGTDAGARRAVEEFTAGQELSFFEVGFSMNWRKP
jgi:hypothetical protein